MSIALSHYELQATGRKNVTDRYLFGLGIMLTGYALFGRGFAYLGLPPIFIGEVMLALGLFILLLTSGWEKILNSVQALLIFPLVFWCALQTFPYIKEYRADALRDAAMWGYSAYAFIVGGMILARPQRLVGLIRFYRVFAVIFLVVMPVLMVIQTAFPDHIPRISESQPILFSARRGTTMVHLAAIAIFLDAGFGKMRWLPLAVMPFIFVFSSNRAGMVAFAGALAVVAAMGGLRRITVGVGCVLVGGLLLLVVFGDYIKLPGPRDEPMKGSMILDKIASISGDSDESRWGNTTEWRMNWWTDIFNYTVRGKYFWTGKGFGVNLADDDGYQIGKGAKAIRSPHNGHMCLLARSGVPGFLCWVTLQAVWISSMLRAFRQARRDEGHKAWAALFLFFLGYWTAEMIQIAFDVEIEGPMGGIWFWTMFGVGIAALRIYQTNPEILRGDPADYLPKPKQPLAVPAYRDNRYL